VSSEPTPDAHPVPPLAPPTPRDERPLWRKVLPFVLALGLTGLLVWRLDLAAFVRHLRGVNYPAFLGFCWVFVVLLLAADSLATSFVYSKTVCPVRFRDLFLIRGASYLPSMLNHHVGQAWLTWYMSRAYKAPLWRVAGATLLVYATTFASLFLFGAISLVFDRKGAPWLIPLLAVVFVAGIGYLVVIRIKPAFLVKRQVLAPLFDVGIVGHMQALALRIPHILVLFLGTWLPFRFFGVDIPPGAAFAYIPVLMVVSALPITPQGVGTRDWFSLHYFSQYGAGNQAEQEAAVAAATLSFAVALSLFQAVFALLLMHRALRVLNQPATGTTDGEDEPTA
jgi:Lysylphosphatidylglycerol synthase TM region